MTTRLEVIRELQEQVQLAYAKADEDPAHEAEYDWRIEYLEESIAELDAMTDEEFAAREKGNK